MLEVIVVSDDTPLLLPVGLLDQLRANLDLDSNQLTLRAIGVTTSMTKLPTGHTSRARLFCVPVQR